MSDAIPSTQLADQLADLQRKLNVLALAVHNHLQLNQQSASEPEWKWIPRHAASMDNLRSALNQARAS